MKRALAYALFASGSHSYELNTCFAERSTKFSWEDRQFVSLHQVGEMWQGEVHLF